MKTLFLMNDLTNNDTFFFELEGDYSQLHECDLNNLPYQNFGMKDLRDKLLSLIYDYDDDCDDDANSDGKFIIEKLIVPTKDWDYYARVAI